MCRDVNVINSIERERQDYFVIIVSGIAVAILIQFIPSLFFQAKYKCLIVDLSFLIAFAFILFRIMVKPRKIDKELMMRINLSELGKKGIVDLIDGRTFYRTDNKPINFANTSVEKGIEFAGVKKTKRDYYELKVARLMVQALQNSKSPEEAVIKFIDLYEKEKVADPVFRDAEFKSTLSFLVGMYNMSSVAGIVEKTVTLIPRRLLAIVSRLLASAYRMIPIVGGIATANVEAAEAISEIGENLSARVESSAYMPVDLRMIMGDRYSIISNVLQKQILEEMRRQQSPA